MGSPAKAPSPGTSFPFTGLALVMLLVQAVVTATLPQNPYRSLLTVAALLATGYCVLALVAGRAVRLSRAEVLAFTVGLTILITSLSAVLVSVLGIPITDNAITILGVPIAVAAWYLQRTHEAASTAVRRGLRAIFDFSDYTRQEKVLAAGLLVAIFVALVAFILLSASLYPDVLSPGVAIVGPDGTPASLPTAFGNGTAQRVAVNVLGGSAGGAFELRIRLVPQNATGNESFHPVPSANPLRLDPFAESTTNLTIAPQGTWSESLSVIVAAPGRYDLRFDLIGPSGAVAASNVLPIAVS